MRRLLRFAVCAALIFALITANLCFVSAAESFYSSADTLLIKNHIEADAGLSSYSTVQGACTDGKYAYFALMNGGATILKYDLKSWELAESKRITNVGHANDMTYNSDKGYIVVANNTPYFDVITLLNPKTLEAIEDVQLDIEIYSIAYNAKRKQYVVGISGSYDFALLDEKFKVVKKFKGEKTGYTRQGCDCDDDYIYFVQSGASNALVVYDYKGKNVALMAMDDSNEVENIFHIGNSFYVSMFYYGSYVHRVAFSPRTAVTFNVSYDANGGEGKMDSTTVTYGKSTKLRPNSFTRGGYFFGGWIVRRDSDGKYVGKKLGSKDYEWLDEEDVNSWELYKDGQNVAKTVRFGSVEMSAFWINESYDLYYDCGIGEGYMEPVRLDYKEKYTVPESAYTCEGYIFDGYRATRDCDGRVYGLRKGSDRPEWLKPDDLKKSYHIKPGEELSKLTYDGSVTLTAMFKYAYTFEDDGATLVEYVGVDEKVFIPDNDGALNTIAEGSFKDNEIMTELHIPESVSSLESKAVTDCPKLRNIYFDGSVPEDFSSESVTGADDPIFFRMVDDVPMCIGFLSSPDCAPLIHMESRALDGVIRTKSVLNDSVKELKAVFGQT